MQSIIEIISQPWSWYFAGSLIALVMFLLIYFGKTFGFSSNYRILCAACGAGKFADYFNYDWRAQIWNLLFLVGSIIGGWLAATYLSNGGSVQLAASTVSDLSSFGLAPPRGMQPAEIFNFHFLFSLKGFILLIAGGFLVGFGTRYADGCTSGHAITGLSHFQWTSLLAVIGFFIGGLVMTHFILPLIFKL